MSVDNKTPSPQRRANGAGRIILGDLGMSIGVIAAGIFFLVGAFDIGGLGGYSQIGPRFFPFLVAAGLLVCGALLMLQALRGKGSSAEDSEDVDPAARVDWWPVGLLGAALVAAILLIEVLGFILATTLLFCGAAFGFGSRRFVRDALIGLVLTTLVYLAFTRLLDLNLPAGILPL